MQSLRKTVWRLVSKPVDNSVKCGGLADEWAYQQEASCSIHRNMCDYAQLVHGYLKYLPNFYFARWVVRNGGS